MSYLSPLKCATNSKRYLNTDKRGGASRTDAYETNASKASFYGGGKRSWATSVADGALSPQLNKKQTSRFGDQSSTSFKSKTPLKMRGDDGSGMMDSSFKRAATNLGNKMGGNRSGANSPDQRMGSVIDDPM